MKTIKAFVSVEDSDLPKYLVGVFRSVATGRPLVRCGRRFTTVLRSTQDGREAATLYLLDCATRQARVAGWPAIDLVNGGAS